MIQLVDHHNLANFYELFVNSVNSDYPTLSKEMKATFLYFYTKERFDHVFTNSSYIGYLASHDKKTAGFISFSSPQLGVSNCEWLGVKSSFRNRGIARSLLKAWEAYALNYHSYCLTLICEENKIKFYEKMGFRISWQMPSNFYFWQIPSNFYFLLKYIS